LIVSVIQPMSLGRLLAVARVRSSAELREMTCQPSVCAWLSWWKIYGEAARRAAD
jgi:hypothetical protein